MKFTLGGKSVMLKGDPFLGKSLVSLKAMGKIIQQEGQEILVELGTCILMNDEIQEISPSILRVLEEFDQVFHMPNGLPPIRGKEHGIVLKEGTNAINVRPYRYPHYLKDEIKKLVKEMLEAEVIQPSSSPFSSPVLLVKKRMAIGGFA